MHCVPPQPLHNHNTPYRITQFNTQSGTTVQTSSPAVHITISPWPRSFLLAIQPTWPGQTKKVYNTIWIPHREVHPHTHRQSTRDSIMKIPWHSQNKYTMNSLCYCTKQTLFPNSRTKPEPKSHWWPGLWLPSTGDPLSFSALVAYLAARSVKVL